MSAAPTGVERRAGQRHAARLSEPSRRRPTPSRRTATVDVLRPSAPASTRPRPASPATDSVHLHGDAAATARRTRRPSTSASPASTVATAVLIARDDDVATIVQHREASSTPLDNDTGLWGSTLSRQRRAHARRCDLRSATGRAPTRPTPGYSGSDGFAYTIQESGGQQALQRRRAHGQRPAGERRVHILVAPADTGYRLSVSGAPRPGGAIPSGGTAELGARRPRDPRRASAARSCARVRRRREGTATLSGPHALDAGSAEDRQGLQRPASAATASSDYNGRRRRAARRGSITQTFPQAAAARSARAPAATATCPILVGSKVFAVLPPQRSDVGVTCVDRATGERLPGLPEVPTINGSDGSTAPTSTARPSSSGTKICVAPADREPLRRQSPRSGCSAGTRRRTAPAADAIVDRVDRRRAQPNASAPVGRRRQRRGSAPTPGRLYCVDPAHGRDRAARSRHRPAERTGSRPLRHRQPRLARVLSRAEAATRSRASTSSTRRDVQRAGTRRRRSAARGTSSTSSTRPARPIGVCVVPRANGALPDATPRPTTARP